MPSRHGVSYKTHLPNLFLERKGALLDAIIFDFDGVVVDSEPIHFECFRKVLQSVGVELTREAYYEKYVGFDDHDCFVAAMRDNGAPADEPQIAALIATKTTIVREVFGTSVRALPGAAELIRSVVEADVPLGICSGGIREEIELAARAVGVLESFMTIVASQDVARGKPDPQGYLLALSRLSRLAGRSMLAERCVVIEDAPAGIRAARDAGMKVLAVTNSFGAEALGAADRVATSLEDVTFASLEELLEDRL